MAWVLFLVIVVITALLFPDASTVGSLWILKRRALGAAPHPSRRSCTLPPCCSSSWPRRARAQGSIRVAFCSLLAHVDGGVEGRRRRIVACFNESQEAYEVLALSLPPGPGADSKFLLAVIGGDPPDVMATWNPIIPSWAEAGMLKSLDLLMSRQEKERFFADAYPIAKKIGMYKERLYGMPVGINVWALYYRPDQFRQAGLDPDRFPDSLEALVSLGTKLDRFDARGNLNRLGFLPAWLGGELLVYGPVFGGGFYDWKKGELTLDSPANLRCLSSLVDGRKARGLDVVTRFESAQNAGASVEWPFIGGSLAITLDGQWRIEQLAKYAPGLEYRVAPIPPPEGGRKLAGHSDGNFMIVPISAKQVDGAWAFIKYWSGILDPEQAAELHTWGGWLPALSSVARAEAYRHYLDRYPQFRVFVDMMSSENLEASPPVPYQLYVVDRITAIDQAAMRGLVSPSEALGDLVRDVDRERQRRRSLRYED
jgi:multiple sugar transport system substrate-binding protein